MTQVSVSLGIVAAYAVFCATWSGATGHSQATKVESAPQHSTISCIGSLLAEAVPASGPACERELFAKFGRPFMFPPHNGIAYGISSAPDQPTTLSLWEDNRTDKPVTVLMGCGNGVFSHIDVFDSEAHRVISSIEIAAQNSDEKSRFTCESTVLGSEPAHTMSIIDHAELGQAYDLGEGRYTIAERYPPAPYTVGTEDHRKSSPPSGLTITLTRATY